MRHISISKRGLHVAICGTLAVVVVACSGGDNSTPSSSSTSASTMAASDRGVQVTWSPSAVVQNITPGETVTATLTLTANRSTPDAVLRVVPEIAPYVSASPAAVGPLSAGQSVQVTLTFAAKADALPLTASGTVQLRAAAESTKTLSKPLPTTVNVAWPQFEDAATGVRFSYAAFGQPANIQVVDFTELPPIADFDFNRSMIVMFAAPGAPIASQYTLFLGPNLSFPDLQSWFLARVDRGRNLLGAGAYQFSRLPNGVTALFRQPSNPMQSDGATPDVYALSASGRTLIAIQTSIDSQIDLLGVSAATLAQAYQAVLGSLNVP